MLTRLRLFLFAFAITCLAPEMLHAQLNLYSRVTDPRTLARLDGPDSQPLRYACRFGFPPERDASDQYSIIAQDTGAGIISHIWTATDASDTLIFIKLYIDEKLVFSGSYRAFFRSINGVLRAPLDSLSAGAFICDVQMAYRKSFKITCTAQTTNAYYAIAWRPVANPNLLVPFDFNQPYTIQYHQIDAESLIATRSSPWKKEKPLQLIRYDTIGANTKTTIAEIAGPAMIQMVRFTSASYDFGQYDSVWLDMYWDGSPYLAVHVPLTDFFCSAKGSIPIRSLSIRADTGGLTCYFPMPFSGSAKIELTNSSTRVLRIGTTINYTKEPIDKNAYGYFHAYFSHSNLTRYHILHPILHSLGRGKFIGLYLDIPHNHSGVALEGDPIVKIDSNVRNNFRYTGAEDYFNGGWWFNWELFSYHFGGYTKLLEACYRFHYLDAVDFKSSIDFDFQHGGDNDNFENYRSVAYYYKQPISFWVSRDTIKEGERWNVSGAGYKPNSTIIAKFDSTQTIFTTTANASGEFNAYLICPASGKQGARKLSVNEEERPEPIYVINAPAIDAITDSLPVTLRYRDTLLVTGTGFDAGERIQIFLDSILLSDTSWVVGNDYRFFAIVRMPNIADWKYHLRAVGDHHHEAMARDLITITRILPYEFEDLIPWAAADSGYFYFDYLMGYWYAHWSHQAGATFNPPHANLKVAFKFYVPVSDTFDVRMFLTQGTHFARYSYSIDGGPASYFEGFKRPSFGNPVPSDTIRIGTIYFEKDTHTVVFKCVGRDSAAEEWKLCADLLLLRPTTKLPLPKGVFVNDTILSGINSREAINSYISLYPNPVLAGDLTVRLVLPKNEIFDGSIDITISDILGRKVSEQLNIPMSFNGILTHFDVRSLVSGNYVAELTIHSGSKLQRLTRMLVVNH